MFQEIYVIDEHVELTEVLKLAFSYIKLKSTKIGAF